MKSFFSSFFRSSLCLLTLWSLTLGASAQEGTIQVSPMIDEIRIGNGTIPERVLTISNVNTVTSYDIRLEPFDVEIEPSSHAVSYLPEASKGNTKRSLASWLDLDENQFVLAPGEERKLSYRIQKPDGVADGSYYASLNVSFTPQSSAPQEESFVKVKQSIGSLILVNVSKEGDVTNEDLSDFLVTPLRLVPGGDAMKAQVMVTNNLLRYLRLRSHIRITDLDGEVYYDSSAADQRVFPGETTAVSQSFPAQYMRSEIPLLLSYELYSLGLDRVIASEQQAIGAEHSFVGDLSGLKGVLGLVILVMGFSCVYVFRQGSQRRKKGKK